MNHILTNEKNSIFPFATKLLRVKTYKNPKSAILNPSAILFICEILIESASSSKYITKTVPDLKSIKCNWIDSIKTKKSTSAPSTLAPSFWI
jgi:hypothetical protein